MHAPSRFGGAGRFFVRTKAPESSTGFRAEGSGAYGHAQGHPRHSRPDPVGGVPLPSPGGPEGQSRWPSLPASASIRSDILAPCIPSLSRRLPSASLPLRATWPPRSLWRTPRSRTRRSEPPSRSPLTLPLMWSARTQSLDSRPARHHSQRQESTRSIARASTSPGSRSIARAMRRR